MVEYFHRRPYSWFSAFTFLLSYIGADYRDGAAVQLDLVQEPTTRRFRDLGGSAQEALLRSDQPFLEAQLRMRGFDLIIANGDGPHSAIQSIFGPSRDISSLVDPLVGQASRWKPRGEYCPLNISVIRIGDREAFLVGLRPQLKKNAEATGLMELGDILVALMDNHYQELAGLG